MVLDSAQLGWLSARCPCIFTACVFFIMYGPAVDDADQFSWVWVSIMRQTLEAVLSVSITGKTVQIE